jgi:hypothetical protein
MSENQQFRPLADIDRGGIEDRTMKHDLAIELGGGLDPSDHSAGVRFADIAEALGLADLELHDGLHPLTHRA